MSNETSNQVTINGVTFQLPALATVTISNKKQYVMGIANNQPCYTDDADNAWHLATNENARRLWSALMSAKVDPNSVGWEPSHLSALDSSNAET